MQGNVHRICHEDVTDAKLYELIGELEIAAKVPLRDDLKRLSVFIVLAFHLTLTPLLSITSKEQANALFNLEYLDH